MAGQATLGVLGDTAESKRLHTTLKKKYQAINSTVMIKTCVLCFFTVTLEAQTPPKEEWE